MLVASGAPAFTPFGGDDTGTIPSDTPKGPITKCENAAGKAAGKFFAAILKCHASRATGKLVDEAGEETCEGTAKTKFLATKLVGCPACINVNSLATSVENLADSHNDQIYCNAGAPFGGDDTGNIPPDGAKGPIMKCENLVGKGVGKLFAAVLKCHSDRAVGKTTDDTGEDTCESTAQGKFALTKTDGCPGCINLTTVGNFFVNLADTNNNLFYCEAPPAPTKLSFTTALGSTSCGGPSFAGFVAPGAPFSGEVDNISSTKIGDLGLGCLYVGGGSAGTPANQIPDAAQSLFDLGTPSGGNVPLTASSGTSAQNCTKGAGPGHHCIGGSGGALACSADATCGGTAGSCGLDANCNFGPPLPITGALPVCVMNAIITDASGTAQPAAGTSTVDIPLSSRVYLTANATSPCPKCIAGHCDSTWKDGGSNASPNSGAACTAVGSQGTSLQCGVPLQDFQGALSVDLNPLTTGPVMLTSATGMFCPSQAHAGAFHLGTATTIKETGVPAADLSDNLPHSSTLASVFCIPASLSAAINAVGDLPGPGAIGLIGNAQLVP
jgi:hypothetical protein